MISHETLLIIGAGGHGQVVADILLSLRDAGHPIEVTGFLDDNGSLWGGRALGLPILGGVSQHAEFAHAALLLGIGDNAIRKRIYDRMLAAGERFVTAIHPRATVGRDVAIDPGSVLCAGVVVNPGARIGANCILNTASSVDHHCQIADHVHIAPGAHLGGEVQVEEGVLIGIGATVAPRCRVGAWSIVGAGAVVVRDVGAGVTVVGVPAQPRR